MDTSISMLGNSVILYSSIIVTIIKINPRISVISDDIILSDDTNIEIADNEKDKYTNDLTELHLNSVGVSHKSYEFNNHQFALAIDAAAPVAAYKPNYIEYIPTTYEEVIKLAELLNSPIVTAAGHGCEAAIDVEKYIEMNGL